MQQKNEKNQYDLTEKCSTHLYNTIGKGLQAVVSRSDKCV